MNLFRRLVSHTGILHTTPAHALVVASHVAICTRCLSSSHPTNSPKASKIANPSQRPTTTPGPRPPAEPPLLLDPKPTSEPTLQPLSRPLGLPSSPKPGQNSGVDLRTWRERRDDFFDWDKHLARRRELLRKAAKPYFRDWSNLKFHAGKLFVAPSRLLRADKALYFPNLRGCTLDSPKDERDTTDVLKGQCVSVVRVYTGRWAEGQANTWLEEEKLDKLLNEGQKADILQRVNVNIEENAMKIRIVKMFMGWQRRVVEAKLHGMNFLVTRGVTDQIRQALGMMNSQIGYVFLVDGYCRIRWAGCAEAGKEEKDSLLRGVVKLVQDLKKLQDLGEESADPVERQRLNSFVVRVPALLR